GRDLLLEEQLLDLLARQRRIDAVDDRILLLDSRTRRRRGRDRAARVGGDVARLRRLRALDHDVEELLRVRERRVVEALRDVRPVRRRAARRARRSAACKRGRRGYEPQDERGDSDEALAALAPEGARALLLRPTSRQTHRPTSVAAETALQEST